MVNMNIPNCPKNMRHCPKAQCPQYPCWAYDEHMNKSDRDEKNKDRGWD